jgi:hypothetical protein
MGVLNASVNTIIILAHRSSSRGYRKCLQDTSKFYNISECFLLRPQ